MASAIDALGAMTIYSGDQLMIHRGGVDVDRLQDILPMGVAASIKKVHREVLHNRMQEAVIVEFDNTHVATLHLMMGTIDPVDDRLLQEFQAKCLMIHDL